jgi:hypothetical protein
VVAAATAFDVMTRRLAIAVISLCCTACINVPRNPNCEWSDEAAMPLDLNTTAHRRHLGADARVAEELAIRYADVTRGHRSGHFEGNDAYHRVREQCLAALAREIASRHRIQPSQVANAVGQRDARLDASVMVVFAAIFGLAANGLARRLRERFPPGERWAALLCTAAAGALLSASGVMLGAIGASIVEMIQLGDTHLSYRTSRLPWEQHRLLLFVGGLALFGAIAAIHRRRQPAAPADLSRAEWPRSG